MGEQCLKHEYIGAFYRQTFNKENCPYCTIAQQAERIAELEEENIAWQSRHKGSVEDCCAYKNELDSLKRENEELKAENAELTAIIIKCKTPEQYNSLKAHCADLQREVEELRKQLEQYRRPKRVHSCTIPGCTSCGNPPEGNYTYEDIMAREG